jgi:hypothetical protein
MLRFVILVPIVNIRQVFIFMYEENNTLLVEEFRTYNNVIREIVSICLSFVFSSKPLNQFCICMMLQILFILFYTLIGFILTCQITFTNNILSIP